MNKYLFFIIFGLFSATLCLHSQNIKKKYSSHSGKDGAVYFIHPMKGFKSDQLPNGLEYDITYISKVDSVRFNCTYYSPKPLSIDSVAFKNESVRIVCEPVALLFTEPNKKDLWKTRISVQADAAPFWGLYPNDNAYSLILYTASGTYEFGMKEKEWQKQSAIVSKISEVIEYNK